MKFSVITEVNNLGLIDKLNGDDDRLEKVRKASSILVDRIEGDRNLLIPYVLAGLSENVDEQDLAIMDCEQALLSAWETAKSVYGIEKPINLYRYMLLDACNQMVAESKSNSYVLWNTVADIYTYLQFGNERHLIQQMVQNWLEISEEFVFEHIENIHVKEIELVGKTKKKAIPILSFNKEEFEEKLFLAMGPHSADGTPYTTEQVQNKNYASVGLEWNKSFIPKFSKIFEGYISELNKGAHEISNLFAQQEAEREEIYSKNREQLMTNYQEVIGKIKLQNNLKFESLWWSQSMYSPLLHKSYREMNLYIATIVMVKDLLSFVDLVAPDSLSYLLLEVVHKLEYENSGIKISLSKIFEDLTNLKESVPSSVKDSNLDKCSNKLLNIDDIIEFAISDLQIDSIEKRFISPAIDISLPQLAQALFRQELAKKFISMEA